MWEGGVPHPEGTWWAWVRLGWGIVRKRVRNCGLLVAGLWPLRSDPHRETDNTLVLSFVGQTR